jgi:hypothetical protein
MDINDDQSLDYIYMGIWNFIYIPYFKSVRNFTVVIVRVIAFMCYLVLT